MQPTDENLYRQMLALNGHAGNIKAVLNIQAAVNRYAAGNIDAAGSIEPAVNSI